MTLGLSSLTLGATAQADSLSLTYANGYYGNPAYSIHYRHGPDCYVSDYRVPRHVHHHHDKHHKHYKHGKHHVYRGHDRHDYGGHQGRRDDHRSGYRNSRKYGGDQHTAQRGGGHPKRTHTAYAGH
jgi:hypothetical protein